MGHNVTHALYQRVLGPDRFLMWFLSNVIEQCELVVYSFALLSFIPSGFVLLFLLPPGLSCFVMSSLNINSYCPGCLCITGIVACACNYCCQQLFHICCRTLHRKGERASGHNCFGMTRISSLLYFFCFIKMELISMSITQWIERLG